MAHLKSCLLAASLIISSGVQSTQASSDSDALAAVIASRSAQDTARDDARHPAQTLAFMQVTPGMTVAEGLPGGGWYTNILANYLGKDGTLYGVNYADRMWPLFSFATPEFVAKRIAASEKFPALVATFTDNGIVTQGFTFETLPTDVTGSVDRVLLIRALHNLNRFEPQANTLTKALVTVKAMLKTDGMVGVVQHRAPESASDEWADGNRGYLKQSAVIDIFAKAGFELVAESEINANPKDKPGADDIVWRLPPSLRGSEEGSAQREAILAIGESDRMTLLFRAAP
jgi:predicted methyltransferase